MARHRCGDIRPLDAEAGGRNCSRDRDFRLYSFSGVGDADDSKVQPGPRVRDGDATLVIFCALENGAQ